MSENFAKKIRQKLSGLQKCHDFLEALAALQVGIHVFCNPLLVLLFCNIQAWRKESEERIKGKNEKQKCVCAAGGDRQRDHRCSGDHRFDP